ncbi:hypothetical protein RhiirA4_402783 [Rhizophagus irregularis]|uniref:Uncharacterized protein n=1 Tax=Rhizophagus irregularis TaxID=588596 RepID=A0A2I1GJF2_9GLOM|nr:hypothetical protein RhiirA4_402783 [Rhizophagus irregularis]
MTWKVISTPLPKFFSDDYGYENPNVKSTYPLISSSIPLSITNINITYHLSVTISTNNVSIYQYNNNDDLPILRQSVSGDSLYFSDWTSNNPLIGVERNRWKFNTSKHILISG